MPIPARGTGVWTGARRVHRVPSQVQVSPRARSPSKPPNSNVFPWATSNATPGADRGEGPALDSDARLADAGFVASPPAESMAHTIEVTARALSRRRIVYPLTEGSV